jgi:F420H(2)-dependent quinone reductase
MPLCSEYAPSPRDLVREQVELYERSGGTEGNTMHRLPVVILTTVGKRSGKLRKTPIMRVESGGQYVLVASMAGAPSHPDWYHNVTASMTVVLQDGPRPREYACRVLAGAEREKWWGRAVAAFPTYADYQKMTTREIPLVLLEAT